MALSLLYLIGEPGAGKSAAVARLTRGCGGVVEHVPYVAWTEYSSTLCQLGYDRAHFGGTDALGLASQKHVVRWLLEDCPYPLVLAEGDRLANGRFFSQMIAGGVDLTVVTLMVKPGPLARRRAARAEAVGTAQNEGWLRGRATKLVNLQAEYGTPAWTIDSSRLSPLQVARRLAQHPVGAEFERLRMEPSRAR